MKTLLLISTLLYVVLTVGCSSSYIVSTSPGKDFRSIEEFNTFAREKNGTIALEKDTVSFKSSGILIKSDSLLSFEGFRPKKIATIDQLLKVVFTKASNSLWRSDISLKVSDVQTKSDSIIRFDESVFIKSTTLDKVNEIVLTRISSNTWERSMSIKVTNIHAATDSLFWFNESGITKSVSTDQIKEVVFTETSIWKGIGYGVLGGVAAGLNLCDYLDSKQSYSLWC